LIRLKVKNFIFILSLLIPTLCLADGQAGLGVFLDTITFIEVFGAWIIACFLALTIIRLFNKTALSKKVKRIVWISVLLVAFFHWSMVKFDPYPYDGPIDSIIYKNKKEQWRIEDSLEMMNGKPDSTIESIIASIDTSKVGVYIWLNHEMHFVRKLTEEPDNQRLQDSLTMSIVRKWKK